MRLARHGKQRGFTLIELMVALALSGIVTGGIYTVYITQTRNFAAQEQEVEIHQNARFALDMLAKDVRMAGYGVAAPRAFYFGPANDGRVDLRTDGAVNENVYNSGAGAISNSDAIAIRRSSIDPVDIIYTDNGNNYAICSTTPPLSGDITIQAYVPNPFAINLASPSDSGQWFYDTRTVAGIVPGSPTQPTSVCSNKGLASAWPTACQGITTFDNLTLTPSVVTTATAYRSASGTDWCSSGTLSKAQIVYYYVDPAPITGSTVPALMKRVTGGTPQIVAQNIENIQVLYYDKRNAVWRSTFTVAELTNYLIAGNSVNPDKSILSDVSIVRIIVWARASKSDNMFKNNYQAWSAISATDKTFWGVGDDLGAGQDTTQAYMPPNDNYRRVRLTIEVVLRNFGR
ncbi:MAG: prepilin-type N-terminal cleavage/methylation domain-containing protein [Deltaproteobacteria bacterium]|nr:prepilin-type N-terminal cleavage/methylation domain-containing protein [Deltaproteobacteria bacterium]